MERRAAALQASFSQWERCFLFTSDCLWHEFRLGLASSFTPIGSCCFLVQLAAKNLYWSVFKVTDRRFIHSRFVRAHQIQSTFYLASPVRRKEFFNCNSMCLHPPPPNSLLRRENTVRLLTSALGPGVSPVVLLTVCAGLPSEAIATLALSGELNGEVTAKNNSHDLKKEKKRKSISSCVNERE